MKCYHACKDLWKLFINKELTTTTESDAGKYVVRVKKNVIVGHLPHAKDRRFAKMIFYLLKADKYVECKVIITGT